MTAVPTSRLERKERSRLLKQFWVFLGAALGIVVVFIFLIMPGVIWFMNSVFGTGTDFVAKDVLPPQQPQINAPAAAVNSNQIKFQGFTEPQAEVTLLQDKREKQTTIANETGAFSFDVKLTEGDQVLAALAVDKAGNKSALSKEYVVILDTKIPEDLKLSLSEGITEVIGKDKAAYKIDGVTEPKAKVYINGRMVLPNKDGEFSTLFQLQPGENSITFKVVDQGGNEYQVERKVVFTP